MTIEQRLFQSIDRLLPRYRELLIELVREPSTLGNERAAQLRVVRALRQQGLLPVLYDLDLGRLGKHPAFAPTAHAYAGRPNVRAIIPGSGNGRSIALNGHIDVVSPEPETWWSHSPWSGDIDGNRLYGRGTYDMKGGLAASLLALHSVHDSLPALPGTILFESVIEEECTGNGTLAARLDSPEVDAALIAEPTDQQVWLATLGVLWLEISVVGRPAYVGQAGAYVNAIDKACDLAIALRSLPDGINRDFSHPAYADGARPFTLNVGKIHGGDWASNVPLECTLTVRMSFPIGWPVDRAQQLVEECVSSFAAKDAWLCEHPPLVRYPGFRATGWQIADEAPLIRLLDDVHRSVTGARLGHTAFAGAADAHYFPSSTQVAFYGPSGGNQHAPDEYVELDSFVDTARVIALAVVEWCSQPCPNHDA